jgi:hypothetical protein
VALFSRDNYRKLLALVSLPLAVAIVIPVIVVLGLSYYVRAAVIGLIGIVRHFLGYKPPAETAPVQPPHVFEAGETASNIEREKSRDR